MLLQRLTTVEGVPKIELTGGFAAAGLLSLLRSHASRPYALSAYLSMYFLLERGFGSSKTSGILTGVITNPSPIRQLVRLHGRRFGRRRLGLRTADECCSYRQRFLVDFIVAENFHLAA